MSTPRRRRAAARVSLATSALALVALLAGCGQEDDDRASDPAGQGSSEPTPTLPTEPTSPNESTTATPTPPGEGVGDPVQVTGDAGVTAATLVSATEGGGRVETLASPLTTEQERGEFVSQFTGDLGGNVLAAVDALPQDGSLPYGVVAAIGCDAPVSVAVNAGEAGFEVEAMMPKKTVQCLAPVTHVVVFSTPAA